MENLLQRRNWENKGGALPCTRPSHVQAFLARGKQSLLDRLRNWILEDETNSLPTDRHCWPWRPKSSPPSPPRFLGSRPCWGEGTRRLLVRTLLAGNPHQAVHHAFVLRLPADLLGRRLHLQQQLHPLDGRHRRLGHSSRDPACQQVLPEGLDLKEPLSRLLLRRLLSRVKLHSGKTDVKPNSSQVKTSARETTKGSREPLLRRPGGKAALRTLGDQRTTAGRSCAGASNRLPPPGAAHVTADTRFLGTQRCVGKSPCQAFLRVRRVRRRGFWAGKVQEGTPRAVPV